jgi:hypothetical protein
MFEDLYDAISFLWSRTWPTAQGAITEIEVERIKHARRDDTWRLAARHQLHVGQPVLVRYRRDDPSVNTLDRSVRRNL